MSSNIRKYKTCKPGYQTFEMLKLDYANASCSKGKCCALTLFKTAVSQFRTVVTLPKFGKLNMPTFYAAFCSMSFGDNRSKTVTRYVNAATTVWKFNSVIILWSFCVALNYYTFEIWLHDMLKFSSSMADKLAK